MESLADSKIYPIYYLYGEEEFLINEEVNRIKNIFLKGDNSNFHILYGKESLVKEIINLARYMPLIGGNKVIVVKDGDSPKGIDSDEFISYIMNPVKSTSLILTAKKADFKKKYIQILKELNLLREFNLLKSNDLNRWILNEIKGYNKVISEEAINSIIEIVGNNLYALYNELSKLITFVGNRRKIGIEDVKEVVSDIGSETIFDLLNAIIKKDRNRSIYLMNRIINKGEPLLLILNMIARHLRMAWIGIEMLNNGMSEKDIWRMVKINTKYLKGININELKDLLLKIQKIDISLKSLSISKEGLLKDLTIEMAL